MLSALTRVPFNFWNTEFYILQIMSSPSVPLQRECVKSISQGLKLNHHRKYHYTFLKHMRIWGANICRVAKCAYLHGCYWNALLLKKIVKKMQNDFSIKICGPERLLWASNDSIQSGMVVFRSNRSVLGLEWRSSKWCSISRMLLLLQGLQFHGWGTVMAPFHSSPRSLFLLLEVVPGWTIWA